MRTVTYGAACTLDGFIAGEDGEIDWLHFSKDVSQIMRDYCGSGGGGGRSSPGMRTYVFSRTLRTIEAKGVELVCEDAAAFVRDLKARQGKGICVMGGGDPAGSLFGADLYLSSEARGLISWR